MRLLDRLQPVVLLVMRLVLGAIMVAHGYHKVLAGLHHFGQSVGGPGLSWLGFVSALAEFFGGLFLFTGFFTRVAALAICIDLMAAIWNVNWQNGLAGDHGYEFPLAAATLAFALIFLGAGPISLDHALRGGSGASSR